MGNFWEVSTVTEVSTGISADGAKNGHKTHNEPYLPFMMTKTQGRWIIFYVRQMNDLFVKFSRSFWADTVVSMGISLVWSHKWSQKQISYHIYLS